MLSSTDMFFELLQLSLGHRDSLSRNPSEEEWDTLYQLARKQSLTAVLYPTIEQCFAAAYPGRKPKILLRWYLQQQKNLKRYEMQVERARQLTHLFDKAGFKSCVLKGLGTAQYYPHPENRQCGDIDLWVKGRRDDILGFIKSKHFAVGHADVKHVEVAFFSDTPVEVHFRPSWMYNVLADKRLRAFFTQNADRQFDNFQSQLGFARTTVDFDLVYSAVHIYRHIFSEGIGLRQLMDYHYILQNSTEEQRQAAAQTMSSLRMGSFMGGIMWILQRVLGMKDHLLPCPADSKHGEFLLSEILTGGNFGQFDERITRIDKEERFKRGFYQLGRNLRFLSYYPTEVACSPFWKLGHYCWRKKKGYL